MTPTTKATQPPSYEDILALLRESTWYAGNRKNTANCKAWKAVVKDALERAEGR